MSLPLPLTPNRRASFDIERLRNERFGFDMRVVTCEEGEREKKGLNRSLHSTNVNALKTSVIWVV